MTTISPDVKIEPAEQSGVEYSEVEQRFVDLTAQLLEATVELDITSVEELASGGPRSLGSLFEKVNEAEDRCNAKEGLVENVILPLDAIREEHNGSAPGMLGGFFGTNYSLTLSDKGVYQLSIHSID